MASQKINERHQLSGGISWVNNSYQQPDRKIYYGTPTGNNEVLLNFGGNNLIRQYLDISGKNYLSAFAEYKAFLGEKFDNNEYPFTLNVGYNGYFDKEVLLIDLYSVD